MSKYVPESYEYYYIKYWNGNNDPSLFPFLMKAYELHPEKVELYDDFISYYEMTFNGDKKREFCQKWYNSNDIPKSIYDYNFNVLMSLEKNAILISNGAMDTYPVWILQEIQNIRKDVIVLYIDLMGNKKYLNRLYQKYHINPPSYNQLSDKADYFKELARLNPQLPVYLGLTVDPEILKRLKNNLAMKLSLQNFDNLPVLESNWEKKFNKVSIEKLPIEDSRDNGDMFKMMQVNYVYPMLVLHQYYIDSGNQKKADEILTKARQIAKASNKEAFVKKYLKN